MIVAVDLGRLQAAGLAAERLKRMANLELVSALLMLRQLKVGRGEYVVGLVGAPLLAQLENVEAAGRASRLLLGRYQHPFLQPSHSAPCFQTVQPRDPTHVFRALPPLLAALVFSSENLLTAPLGQSPCMRSLHNHLRVAENLRAVALCEQVLCRQRSAGPSCSQSCLQSC